MSGRLPHSALGQGLVRVGAQAQRAKLYAALADDHDHWSAGAIMSRAAELSSWLEGATIPNHNPAGVRHALYAMPGCLLGLTGCWMLGAQRAVAASAGS